MRILATGLHSVKSTVHILLNKGDANRRKCRFLISLLAPGLAVEDHACLIEFTNAKTRTALVGDFPIYKDCTWRQGGNKHEKACITIVLGNCIRLIY